VTLVLQVFLFREGNFLGTEMATGDRIEIGRDPTCDIVVDDEGCSRKHALLFEAGGQLCVQDLGSANGTKLNGAPISAPSYVGPRDDVGIGKHTIKLKMMSAPAVSARPAADSVDVPPTMVADESHAPPSATPAAPQSVDELLSGPQPAAPGSESLDGLFDGFGDDTTASPQPGAIATNAGDPEATLVEDFSAQLKPGQPAPTISSEDRPTKPVPALQSRDSLHDGGYGAGVSASPAASPGFVASEGPTHPSMAAAATHPQPPTVPPISAEEEPVLPPVSADEAPVLDGDDGRAAPAVEWQPSGAWFDEDDEDEDDDFIPAWSAVQKLVREPSADAGEDAEVVVEVLHYRGEQIIDHVVLHEGDEFRFGRSLDKSALRERGLKKPTTMVVHRRGNVAELRVVEGLSGQLFRQGKNEDLAHVPEAQGKKARVPLADGDMGSLDIGGDKVYVRFARESKFTLPPELAGRQRQVRRLHTIAIASAITMWAVGVAFLWILEYRSHQRRVIQLEDTGFAEVFEEEELELEEPEPEPEEEPIEEEPPEDAPPEEKVEDKPKPKVTEVLKNIPKLQDTASSQSLKAALSNIDGIRVPGAAAGFKVSELTGKGPTSNVQIGGAAGGLQTSGLNSVLKKNTGALGAKTDRKIKGRVIKLKRQSKIKGQGTLSREEIQRVIDRNIGQIQVCYERALRKNPSIHGKVQLEWIIKTNGRVGVVKTARSTLASAAAVSCMSKAVKRWRFPKPRGGTVIVNYPFIFNTL
jgi:pSer/pThr/pTyr-binding forkhead associated (FHA) protein